MNKPILEKGLYQEAQKLGLSMSEYLDRLARYEAERGSPAWAWYRPDLKDEAGRPLDAFEQALASYGIVTRGPYAAKADLFFTDPNARVLFPEYLERVFRWAEAEGTNELLIGDLVAETVNIDSTTYKAEYIDEGQDVAALEYTEGAEAPVLNIRRHEQSISLKKYGGQIKMTYEVLRRVQLPVLETWIRKIALDTRRAKVRRAVLTLLNGDGNSNPAPNVNRGTTAWAFDDLVDLMLDFSESFEPSVFVADKSTTLRAILKFPVFIDPSATSQGAGFRDGRWPMPLGKELKYVVGVSEMASPERILAVDKRFALVEVRESGSTLTERDRLIETQFERIVFSEYVGYAKMMTGASRTRSKV